MTTALAVKAAPRRTGTHPPKAERAPPSEGESDLGATEGMPEFLRRKSIGARVAIGAGVAIGAPDSPAEREADEAAERAVAGEQVAPVRALGSAQQRMRGAAGTEPSSSGGMSEPSWSGGMSEPSWSAGISQGVGFAGGDEGARLPAVVRSALEPRFGADFSDVRVHTDDRAARSSAALGARAYTQGTDIYFAGGAWQPQSASGLAVVAHELAHTLQQAGDATGGLVQRLPDPIVPSPDAASPAAPIDSDQARTLAEQVYAALDGWNNEADALNALRGHDAGTRAAIVEEFSAAGHGSLEDYLIDQLDGDDRVNALRLLHAPEENDDCGFMGRALVSGWTIRDDEPCRILYSRPTPASRRQLATQYADSFARLGSGTLEGDIKARMSGWRRDKALALLNRDLTDADEIYFDSVAITGTHDQAVVDRVETVWGHGLTAYQRLVDDWRRFEKNEDHWTTPAFTTMTFMQAMTDELDGEHIAMVSAIDRGATDLESLDASATAESEGAGGLPVTAGPSESDLMAREDVRLRVAHGILDAAADGVGTNEAQIFHAVEQIQHIWQERLARVERLHNTELLEDYRRRWEDERAILQASIAGEMDEGTPDYMRARLLIEGSLTAADEIFLAHAEGDYDKVLSLVTKAWAEDTIDALRTACERPREAPRIGRAAGSDEQIVIRSAFTLILAVPVSHGDHGARLYPLLNDGTQISRGRARLAHDLEEGTSDSDLQHVHQFLTTPGLEAGVRDAVIAAYVSAHESAMPAVPEGEEAPSPNRRFVQYVMQRYDRSHAAFGVQDLLDPSSDISELSRRADDRMSAERRGIFAHDIESWTTSIDAITGNDTTAAAEESAARLRWLSAHREDAALMDEARSAAGVDTDAALAEHEFGLHSQRFEDWSALRREIVETFATIVEIAVDLAIVAATGGGAAPLLLASLASVVAGIAVREAALGANYDAISEENAQRLLTAAVTAVAGAAAHEIAGAAVDLERLTRLQTFGVRALSDAAAQIGAQTVQMSFLHHFPTDDEIGVAALSILGSALVAGTLGSATHADPNVVTTATSRIRTRVATGAAQGFMSGVINEGAGFLVGDQDLTGGEMVGRLAVRGTRDAAHGLITSMRDAYMDETSGRPPSLDEDDEGHGTAARRRPPTEDDALDAARRPRASLDDEEIPDARLAPTDEALLARTRRGEVDPSTMERELEIAQRLVRRPSSDPDYDEEIELPNGHIWRRRRGGGWCRFSNGGACIIDRRRSEWRGLSEADREELNGMVRRGHVSIEDLDTLAISRAPDVPWGEVVALLRRLPPNDLARMSELLHAQDIPINHADLEELHAALDRGESARRLIERLYDVRPGLHADTDMADEDPALPRATGEARRQGMISAAAALGVQGGEEWCTNRGIVLDEPLDPRAFDEPHGHGFDATGTDAAMRRVVLEWKGESADTDPGSAATGRPPQMSDEWVGWKLAEMEALGVDPEPFLQAADEGNLVGYAIRTRTSARGTTSTRALPGYEGRVYDPVRVRAAMEQRSALLRRPTRLATTAPDRTSTEIQQDLLASSRPRPRLKEAPGARSAMEDEEGLLSPEEEEQGPRLQLKCAACAAGGAPCPACADAGEKLQKKARAEASGDATPVRKSYPAAAHTSHTALGRTSYPAPARTSYTVARGGVEGASEPLPHLERIQASFGAHDLSGVKTRVGGRAAQASEELGAIGYTLGDRVGFSSAPDIKLAAHEAAHVIQQREGIALEGGIDRPGDEHERRADRVADAVARGEAVDPARDSAAPALPIWLQGGLGKAPRAEAVQRLPTQEPVDAQDYFAKHFIPLALTGVILAQTRTEIHGTGSPYLRWTAGGEWALTEIVMEDILASGPDWYYVHATLEESPENVINAGRGTDDSGYGHPDNDFFVIEEFSRRYAKVINASIQRLGQEVAWEWNRVVRVVGGPDPQVSVDPGSNLPDPANIIPSHPIDRPVARGMCSGLLEFDHEAYRAAHLMEYGPEAPKQLRQGVYFEFERGGGTWLMLRVMDPIDATPQEVALELYGDEAFAHLLTRAGRYYAFQFPPSKMLSPAYDDYWKQLVLDDGGAPLDVIQGYNNTRDAAREMVEAGNDEAILAHSSKLPPTGADRVAIVQRIDVMLSIVDSMDVKAETFGMAGWLSVLHDRLTERRDACDIDDAEAAKWDAQTKEQLAVLGGCATGFSQAWDTATQTYGQTTLAGQTEGVGDVSQYLDKPLNAIAKAFMSAAQVSDLVEIGRERLRAAQDRLVQYPADVLQATLLYVHDVMESLKSDSGYGYIDPGTAAPGFAGYPMIMEQISLSGYVRSLRDALVNDPARAAEMLPDLQKRLELLIFKATTGAGLRLFEDMLQALDQSIKNDNRYFDKKEKIDAVRGKWIEMAGLIKRLDANDPDAVAAVRTKLVALQRDTDFQALVSYVAGVIKDEQRRKRWIAIGALIGIIIVTVLTGGLAAGAAGGGWAGVIAGGLVEGLVFTTLSTLAFKDEFNGKDFVVELGINTVMFGGLRAIGRVFQIAGEVTKLTFGARVAKFTLENILLDASMLTQAEYTKRRALGKDLTAGEVSDILLLNLVLTSATSMIARIGGSALEKFRELKQLKALQEAIVAQQRALELANQAKLLREAAEARELGKKMLVADRAAIEAEQKAVDELVEAANKGEIKVAPEDLKLLEDLKSDNVQIAQQREVAELMLRLEQKGPTDFIATPDDYAALKAKHTELNPEFPPVEQGNKMVITPKPIEGIPSEPITVHKKVGTETAAAEPPAPGEAPWEIGSRPKEYAKYLRKFAKTAKPGEKPPSPEEWFKEQYYQRYLKNLKRPIRNRGPSKSVDQPLTKQEWWEKIGSKPPRNPSGGRGDPVHDAVVGELRAKAEDLYPSPPYRVISNQQIMTPSGARKPDVAVIDTRTGKVVKVYEAARFDESGNFEQPYEAPKITDYDAMGIDYEFHPVGPNKPPGGILTSPPKPPPKVPP